MGALIARYLGGALIKRAITGVGLKNWLRLGAATIVVAAGYFLYSQYQSGQAAKVEVERLEQLIEREREQAKEALETRTEDLQAQSEMFQRQLEREKEDHIAREEFQKKLEEIEASPISDLLRDTLQEVFP